jgi:hypothetical protein
MESTNFFIWVENLLESNCYNKNSSSSLLQVTENRCRQLCLKFLKHDRKTFDISQIIDSSVRLLPILPSDTLRSLVMEMLLSALSTHLTPKHCNLLSFSKLIPLITLTCGDNVDGAKILVVIFQKLGIEWFNNEIASQTTVITKQVLKWCTCVTDTEDAYFLLQVLLCTPHTRSIVKFKPRFLQNYLLPKLVDLLGTNLTSSIKTRIITMLDGLIMMHKKTTIKYICKDHGDKVVTCLVNLTNLLIMEKSCISLTYVMHFILQIQSNSQQIRDFFYMKKWLKILEEISAIDIFGVSLKKQVTESIRLVSFEISPFVILHYKWDGLVHLSCFRKLILCMCNWNCNKVLEFIYNNQLMDNLTPYLINASASASASSSSTDSELKNLIQKWHLSRASASASASATASASTAVWKLGLDSSLFDTDTRAWYFNMNILIESITLPNAPGKSYISSFIYQEMKRTTLLINKSMLYYYTIYCNVENWWQTVSYHTLQSYLVMFEKIDHARLTLTRARARTE